MPFISDSLRAQVKKDFDRVLLSEVKIVHFTQYESSPETPLLVFQSQRRQYYEETRALLHELADLSDKLHLEIHELAADPEGAAQYRIDKIPATVLAVGPNHRIRFFGLPTGTQFGLLVDAIGDLSRGGVSLSEATTETLKALLNEAHIQVFLTSN